MIKNNGKRIIIIVLALLIVTSIGYALFSQNINVSGTATAKGSFDLEYSCIYLTSENMDSWETTQIINASTSEGTCMVNDGMISASTSLSKPGDDAIFRVKITNNGTIPAKLKTVSCPTNDDNENNCYTKDSNDIISTFGMKLANVINANKTEMQSGYLMINAGESIYGYLILKWDDNSQKQLPDAVTKTYELSLGFEQSTN